MKVITTPQCNRPDYTERMLNSLKNCDGIEDYLIVACVEPVSNDVMKLLMNFDSAKQMIIHQNESGLGCNLNTLKSMYSGFEHSTTILHVEDDIILSKDALQKYELWAASPDDSFSFCLYNKIAIQSYNHKDFDKIMTRPQFIPWGFGIRKSNFLRALLNECFSMRGEYLSWDCRINNMCLEKGLSNKYMWLARSNNIGALNGVHVPSAEWHNANQFLHFWAGDL